jgi:glutamyl-tRNA reductase
MPIITVGLSHRTAPVDLRESISITEGALVEALSRLYTFPGIGEAAILSTCNRTEIYAVSQKPQQGWRAVESFLQQQIEDPSLDLAPHLYYYAGRAAAEHLMKVSCGLDSQILGEPQILGQVNFTLRAAQQAGSIGPILHRLFNDAIHAGKRARAETSISRYTTSTSHAAVLLAEAHVSDLRNANVLVVGAGEMAHLAVKALHQRNVHNIGCVNRTYARAAALVEELGGRVFNWFHLDEALRWADVVITATGAPHTVIHAEEVGVILPQRQGRPLVFVDIALPRDVEQSVGALPGAVRYDIDDLRARLDENLAQREATRPEVESIIAEEIISFTTWLQSRKAVPTIVGLRRKVSEIAQAELAEALAQMPDLDEREEEVVRRMVHRMVNKVLHEPTVQLKAASALSPEMGQEYAEATRELFGLHADPEGQEDIESPLLKEDFCTPEHCSCSRHYQTAAAFCSLTFVQHATPNGAD